MVDLLTQANVQIDGAESGDLSGRSVAAAGDVNGDGRSDLIVGASAADGAGRGDLGSIYVVFGSVSLERLDLGELGGAGFRIDGPADEDETGRAVGSAGDVNGDGLDDVIATAGEDRAYVVFGKETTGRVDLAGLGEKGFLIHRPDGGRIAAVASAGDANGDGLGDVIVGAPNASPYGRVDAGSAYIVFGKASSGAVDLGALGEQGFRMDGVCGANDFACGQAEPQEMTLFGAVTGDETGVAVAGAGDINGDGLDDVIVGAPGFSRFVYPIYCGPWWSCQPIPESGQHHSRVGMAYVVYGRSSTQPVDLVEIAEPTSPSDMAWRYFEHPPPGPGPYFSADAVLLRGDDSIGYPIVGDIGAGEGGAAGSSVAGAGDTNGDGSPDLAVGAPGSDTLAGPSALAGTGYAVYSTPWLDAVDLTAIGGAGDVSGVELLGTTAGDKTGASVARAGDVNGDDRADMLVGAPGMDNNGRADSGSAFVVYGQSGAGTTSLGTLGAQGIRIDGAAPGDGLGEATSAGDMDGDGRSDVVAAAKEADPDGRADAGSTYIVNGFADPAVAYDPIAGKVGKPLEPVAPRLKKTGSASLEIEPSLPDGLSFDSATGEISGAPALPVGEVKA